MIQKPHIHETMDKFFRGVRHIRLFKQKNGTKFRFCLEPLLSAYYISPTPRGNIYSREHGCRDWSLPGCGADPRSTKSFSNYVISSLYLQGRSIGPSKSGLPQKLVSCMLARSSHRFMHSSLVQNKYFPSPDGQCT